MNKLLMTVGCLAASAAMAQNYRPAQLAPSPFADTEAQTNVPCVIDRPSLRQYWLALGLVGTPSNNVEVALGHDADGDGMLAVGEEGITLAWDCGAWCVAGNGDWGSGIGNEGDMPLVTSGPDTNGFVTASVEVEVRRHKARPAWLFDPSWNMVRVTRRGVDDPRERVKVRTMTTGMMIFVR